jgi:hypothetical protein
MLKRVFSVAQLLADGKAEDTKVAEHPVLTQLAADQKSRGEDGEFATSEDCGRVVHQLKRRS